MDFGRMQRLCGLPLESIMQNGNGESHCCRRGEGGEVGTGIDREDIKFVTFFIYYQEVFAAGRYARRNGYSMSIHFRLVLFFSPRVQRGNGCETGSDCTARR